MPGGTSRIGRLSRLCGAIHIIAQGCFGYDDIVLLILEQRLEVVVSGRWAGLLQTVMARVEQPLGMKGEEWQQQAGLIYHVGVALELQPESPRGL